MMGHLLHLLVRLIIKEGKWFACVSFTLIRLRQCVGGAPSSHYNQVGYLNISRSDFSLLQSAYHTIFLYFLFLLRYYKSQRLKGVR